MTHRPSDTEAEAETTAVAQRYARRGVSDLYSALRPEVYLGVQERQRAMLRGFAARGYEEPIS